MESMHKSDRLDGNLLYGGKRNLHSPTSSLSRPFLFPLRASGYREEHLVGTGPA
jgi:hypothetical protein